MFPRITDVRHLHEYWLEITFSDGTIAELNFEERVVRRGGVFTALEDVGFFSSAQVDAEIGTVVWPNGVDFCPDVLYSEATGQPIEVTAPA